MKQFQLLFLLIFSVQLNAQKSQDIKDGKWFGEDFTYLEIDSSFVKYNFGEIYTAKCYDFELKKDSLILRNWSSFVDEFDAPPLTFLIKTDSPDSIELIPNSETAKIISNFDRSVISKSMSSKPIVFYRQEHFFDNQIEFKGIEFARTRWAGTPKYKILKIDVDGKAEIIRYKIQEGKLGKEKKIYTSHLPPEELALLKKIFQTSDLKNLSIKRSKPTQCDGIDYHFKFEIEGLEKEFISEQLPEILEPLKNFLEEKYYLLDPTQEGIQAD